MAAQNFKNHGRYVPLYHFVASVICVFLVVNAAIGLWHAYDKNEAIHGSIMQLLTAIAILLLWVFCRTFALKAQDRAIRAEESLRYFAITGKLPDNALTMGQFIALRFASNSEFVELAHRAVAENMKPVDIKKAIQHWREDNYRM